MVITRSRDKINQKEHEKRTRDCRDKLSRELLKYFATLAEGNSRDVPNCDRGFTPLCGPVQLKPGPIHHQFTRHLQYHQIDSPKLWFVEEFLPAVGAPELFCDGEVLIEITSTGARWICFEVNIEVSHRFYHGSYSNSYDI